MRVTPLSVAVIVVRVFLGASILLSMLRQPALAQQSTPPENNVATVAATPTPTTAALTEIPLPPTPGPIPTDISQPTPVPAKTVAVQPTPTFPSLTLTPEPTSSPVDREPPLPPPTPEPIVEVTIAPPQVILEPTPIPWPIGEVPQPSDKDEVKAAIKGDKTKFINDRVQVLVPESQDIVELKVKLKEAKRLTNGNTGLAFSFDIKATDKDKKEVSQFSEPITITLQIADLLGTLDKLAFLAYFDEDKKQWESIEILARDEKAGTLTFATSHFSTYGGGVSPSISQLTSPAAWSMKFNDANVSLFDGALNWSYPLDIPAGPGGVRPYLGVSYNSRRVDGIWEHPNTGFDRRVTDPNPEIAYGWDLDLPEIAWGGIGGWIDPANGTTNRFAWRPYLTLRLNGSSVRVVPDSDWVNNLPGDDWKRWQYRQENYCTDKPTPHPYRAEDRKDLRIRWVCASSDGMNERGQWEVTTGDGTKYVFGSTDDSRQTITGDDAEWTYAGAAHLQTIRWRLKQMVTTKNVTINYDYTTDNSLQAAAERKPNTIFRPTQSPSPTPAPGSSLVGYSPQAPAALKMASWT